MRDRIIINSIEGFLLFCLLLIIVGALILFCRTAMASPLDWLNKCEPYEKQVKQMLISEGVSTDYYYLMVAESRCKSNAVSKRGARGFWQLMPATSKHYGCNDPNNLECSTRAAAKYIKSLESRFHDFDSVIAAYNMGGHNLKSRGMTKEARNLVYTVKELMKCM